MKWRVLSLLLIILIFVGSSLVLGYAHSAPVADWLPVVSAWIVLLIVVTSAFNYYRVQDYDEDDMEELQRRMGMPVDKEWTALLTALLWPIAVLRIIAQENLGLFVLIVSILLAVSVFISARMMGSLF